MRDLTVVELAYVSGGDAPTEPPQDEEPTREWEDIEIGIPIGGGYINGNLGQFIDAANAIIETVSDAAAAIVDAIGKLPDPIMQR